MAYPKHNKSNIYHHKSNCYIKNRMNNQEIIELSKKYEDRKYFEKDPVSFLWKYKDKRDIEVAAVICSILAFGNRQQIYKACEKTLAIMGDSPYQWIMSKKYPLSFGEDKCWYRMLTNFDLANICYFLKQIYTNFDSLEECITHAMKSVGIFDTYIEVLINIFYGCKGIPKETKSCCKRLCLMLRWLVRQNSPVDVGIWKSLDQSKLLIPCDVHVLNKARELGYIKRKSNDMKTCIELTNKCRELVPGDPASVDFALFGMGYEEAHPKEFEESDPKIPLTPQQITLISTYAVLYVNELCNVCVLDLNTMMPNRDSETKKIYKAAFKRVREYQKIVNKISSTSGNIYSNFCDLFDVYVMPVLKEYQESIEEYLDTLPGGFGNTYFLSHVEVARSMTHYSIWETAYRVADSFKYTNNAISLSKYKQKELFIILTNLTKWCFRKAPDIDYNYQPKIVAAYEKLDSILTNPEIISKCIIKAQELEDGIE